MRDDVKKFLFIGAHKERNAFFEQAQSEGIIDFIPPVKGGKRELPDELEKIVFAIKVLRGLPTVDQEEFDDYQTADDVIEKILHLRDSSERLEEEERILRLEIERVAIFGDFSLHDLNYIEREGHRTIQFYCAKKGFSESDDVPDSAIFIGSDHGLDYFVAINESPMQFDGMINMKIEAPVGELKEKLALVQQEVAVFEEQLKGYAKYNTFLHHTLIHRMNSYNLQKAEAFVSLEMDGSLFAVQGWVPVSMLDRLAKVVRNRSVYYEEVAIEDDDTVPTCLENKSFGLIGEDLVHIYDTPSSSDKDPSLWVLCFFALFFAFIVGDGGYGLIFLAVALYIQFKVKKITKLGRRMLKLFYILCATTIIWGVLTNSFFGLNFGPESPLQDVSAVNWLVVQKAEYHHAIKDKTYRQWVSLYPQIDVFKHSKEQLNAAYKERKGEKLYEMFDSYSDSVMLELALMVGVIHICLSFARYLDRNWSGIGWILFIIGGYMYFPYYLGTVSMLQYVFGFDVKTVGVEGAYLMAGGFGLAVLLGLIQKKLMGLLELMTVIQIFGDILSYLRLYALGLAGGIVSATVNELAGSVFFVGGVVILLIGHLINIALSVMGGVIHGLRLNFLEWYHYSFEGGGKIFSPLKKLEIE